MGVYCVDGPNALPVKSCEEVLGRVFSQLTSALSGWQSRLRADPQWMPEIELEVRALCGRGADLVCVGLLADLAGPALDEVCEQTRVGYEYPLERGRPRQIRVQMLGGMIVWITSAFCAARRLAGFSTESRPGAYIELLQYGFAKGCTAAVESKVARQAALCPSLEFAQQELERDGLPLDVKTVRRIARQCGEGLLRQRRREMDAFFANELPAGEELKGQRVCVQLDGGRTKIRGKLRESPAKAAEVNEDGFACGEATGRSRRKAARTCDANWREPKLVTIFVHDEKGKMEKTFRATIDGTFEGPDALAELIAMHLHRLGAAKARSLTFAADGGVWIWARIPAILRMAKLEQVPTQEVLDCYHATHHISQALAAMGLNDAVRQPLYRAQRTLLRNGQWRSVIEGLTELAEDQPEDSQVWTEIEYLRKHGEAGRLKYPTFRGLGLPIGSGAIESTIRRVVNLRLKGNAIAWRQDMAEAILQLRAHVLTDRWDERLKRLRELRRTDARTDWKWEPSDRTPQDELIIENSD